MFLNIFYIYCFYFTIFYYSFPQNFIYSFFFIKLSNKNMFVFLMFFQNSYLQHLQFIFYWTFTFIYFFILCFLSPFLYFTVLIYLSIFCLSNIINKNFNIVCFIYLIYGLIITVFIYNLHNFLLYVLSHYYYYICKSQFYIFMCSN